LPISGPQFLQGERSFLCRNSTVHQLALVIIEKHLQLF
jgi:hypothetical protein